MKKARAIAIYLPQFHPIPENDLWHGRGFTEWTNVAKAKPMFKGHYQPILPADLGFYDLRVPETRIAQADMAREYGVEAFCYWHYWFGNGRRILERPFQEVVDSGKPDFPFCLAWANASWTGIWYGMSDNVLLKQEYPGMEDHKDHFYAMLSAFKDKRYLKVNGKLLFFIYDPLALPNSQEFMDLWNDLARKEGLGGMYFVGATRNDEILQGYDATTHLDPYESPPEKKSLVNRILRRLTGKDFAAALRIKFGRPRRIIECDDFVAYLNNKELRDNELPLVMPNWDNTARSGVRGSVMVNATPEKFDIMVKNALKKIEGRPDEERILFVEAWNEWAEGNYLEPDRKFGTRFLEALKKNIM